MAIDKVYILWEVGDNKDSSKFIDVFTSKKTAQGAADTLAKQTNAEYIVLSYIPHTYNIYKK